MKNKILNSLAIFLLFSTITVAQADIVDIAVGSEDHTTLVAAVKAAELAPILKGDGPYTLFAPTNQAFDNLPEGSLEGLLKPEARGTLSNILSYHVFRGDFNAATIIASIEKGAGKYQIQTLSGGILFASLEDGNVILTDESGATATVIATDLKSTNGTVHVIDSVLMPE